MIRRRIAIGAIALAAVAASAGAVAALSPGSGGDSPAALEWVAPPQLERVPELPSDRVLMGEVRNVAEGPLSLVADDVELVDAKGRPVASTARFAAAFGHALYSPTAAPDEVAELEQIRLGEIAEIAPGDSAPLTLSWRLGGSTGAPVTAEIGGVELPLPGSG